MNKNKGFTLIELLVVIAIIGILSSVVLASLTSARQKGKVAAAESTLSSMRAQAEVGMSNGKYVADVCNVESTGGGIKTLYKSLDPTVTPSARITDLKCGTDAADATKQPFKWAVEAGLPDTSATPTKAGVPTYFCVDSTGFSGVIATKHVTAGNNGPTTTGASCK
jgi:prepilin-type N-terminal cleavage/methylation domain-containing protein